MHGVFIITSKLLYMLRVYFYCWNWIPLNKIFKLSAQIKIKWIAIKTSSRSCCRASSNPMYMVIIDRMLSRYLSDKSAGNFAPENVATIWRPLSEWTKFRISGRKKKYHQWYVNALFKKPLKNNRRVSKAASKWAWLSESDMNIINYLGEPSPYSFRNLKICSNSACISCSVFFKYSQTLFF